MEFLGGTIDPDWRPRCEPGEAPRVLESPTPSIGVRLVLLSPSDMINLHEGDALPSFWPWLELEKRVCLDEDCEVRIPPYTTYDVIALRIEGVRFGRYKFPSDSYGLDRISFNRHYGWAIGPFGSSFLNVPYQATAVKAAMDWLHLPSSTSKGSLWRRFRWLKEKT